MILGLTSDIKSEKSNLLRKNSEKQNNYAQRRKSEKSKESLSHMTSNREQNRL